MLSCTCLFRSPFILVTDQTTALTPYKENLKSWCHVRVCLGITSQFKSKQKNRSSYASRKEVYCVAIQNWLVLLGVGLLSSGKGLLNHFEIEASKQWHKSPRWPGLFWDGSLWGSLLFSFCCFTVPWSILSNSNGSCDCGSSTSTSPPFK